MTNTLYTREGETPFDPQPTPGITHHQQAFRPVRNPHGLNFQAADAEVDRVKLRAEHYAACVTLLRTYDALSDEQIAEHISNRDRVAAILTARTVEREMVATLAWEPMP